MGVDPSRSIHEFPQGVSWRKTTIVGQRFGEIKDVAWASIPHRSEAMCGVGAKVNGAGYSGLMSAAFTIGHHFSVSAFWKAASA
ncbi:hypothetical protein, partial [Klebsiella pneumoniae]|uniref:hypothetical protein n=1 Tax=Klebsiella pneumoniae TaxID=573 RepID=UPI003854BDB4